jgi:predicted DCC family thiol-disulfide oxidoreductase YuxK
VSIHLFLKSVKTTKVDNGRAVYREADSRRTARGRAIWIAGFEVLGVTEDFLPEDEAGVHPILLYDGVCGLCNGTVQFILRRDRAGVFRFAALQGELAKRILARHGIDASALAAVIVVVNFDQPDERLLSRSDAAVFILRHLGAVELGSARPDQRPGPTLGEGSAFWRGAGGLLNFIPRRLRDWGYGIVARNRYRIFGRYDACPMPSEETRARFLDLA